MSSTDDLRPWSVRAINLPEHADNPIHTDAGARAAGYPAAIVAGTSVYAYLIHPAVAAWGADWITGGGGELRLKRAVLDDDLVECTVVHRDEPAAGAASDPSGGAPAATIEASVDGETKATLDVWTAGQPPAMRDGDALPDLELEIDDDWGRYGLRAGDDLELYRADTLTHPAIWPSLANKVFKDQLITGAWIHTRSRIWHQGPARIGDRLVLRSKVIDRFETRAGRRAVVDLQGSVVDGGGERPVVRIEHEALTDLNDG